MFGAPIALGAILGVAQGLTSTRVDSGTSSGLVGPSVLGAFFLAPLLTAAFIRRAYGTFAAAMDELGLPKLAGGGAGVAALAFVPIALTIAGLIGWINGLAITDREQLVECSAGAPWHRTRKGTDMGWSMTYSCDVDGERLHSTIEQPARPDVAEGGTFHLRLARGRFGYWVRLAAPAFGSSPPSPLPSNAPTLAPAPGE
jgi:hypothetical protein